MGTTIQIMVKHNYKCCLSENIEEVETDEEENDRQIVKQLPVIEYENHELIKSVKGDQTSKESFATTIPCNFIK